MIKLDPVYPDTDEWHEWREKCDLEGPALTCSGDVDKKLYPAQGDVLKSVDGPFFGKCVYCESALGSQDGDIDHFRPKATVLERKDNKPVTRTDEDGEKVEHPGYYWLAYRLDNLLPSCLKCNRARTVEDSPNGKRSWFPLSKGSPRAFGTDENIEDEEPLLIHPVLEDPAEHLDVNLDSGEIEEKDERGEECVDIFGLNRRVDLVNARSLVPSTLKGIFDQLTSPTTKPENRYQLRRQLLNFINGKSPHSMIAIKCWNTKLKSENRKKIEKEKEEIRKKEEEIQIREGLGSLGD